MMLVQVQAALASINIISRHRVRTLVKRHTATHTAKTSALPALAKSLCGAWPWVGVVTHDNLLALFGGLLFATFSLAGFFFATFLLSALGFASLFFATLLLATFLLASIFLVIGFAWWWETI